MLKWEFMELAEFRQRLAVERTASQDNADDIITCNWVQCFSWYTVAMAQSFLDCTPGFISHMIADGLESIFRGGETGLVGV